MKLCTSKVRLSYVFIGSPATNDSGEKEYRAALILPKEDKNAKIFIKKFKAACDELMKSDKAHEKWGKINLKSIQYPIKDGDVPNTNGNLVEAHENSYIINAKKTKTMPKLLDINKDEILDPEEIYSGCYAQCIISLYPYGGKGRNGIGVSLEAVRKIADGDRLAGVSISNDDFDESLLDKNDEIDDMFA